MPEPSDSVRIEVAFAGGPIIAANVSPASADAARARPGRRAEGTHQLDTDDGRITVVVPRVVYFKRFTKGAQPGFLSA